MYSLSVLLIEGISSGSTVSPIARNGLAAQFPGVRVTGFQARERGKEDKMFISDDFRLAKAWQAELLAAMDGDPLPQKARADRPRPLK